MLNVMVVVVTVMAMRQHFVQVRQCNMAVVSLHWFHTMLFIVCLLITRKSLQL